MKSLLRFTGRLSFTCGENLLREISVRLVSCGGGYMLICERRQALLMLQFLLRRCFAMSLFLLFGAALAHAQGGIVLVQHAGKDAGTTLSSSLAFPLNNTAGNWIGVVIRAGHSGQSFAVSDTRANTYQQAVLFNQTLDTPNGDTFAIFYAENIAGGANTVTVSESMSNNTLRFAILEYSGLATSNSLDLTSTAVAQGNGTAANSGNATTAAGNLVLGEVISGLVATYTTGTWYTIEERVPAAPNTKLIVEDQIQGTAGGIAASATLSPSNSWGAAVAAFRAAGAGGGTPAGMTANAGTTPQSATISTAFANALAVTVKDAGSNPVSGVNVTFTAPGAGASGVFGNSTATITVATNASGVASAPFTANATAGGPYTVTAAATGLTTVNFSLTNTAAPPTTMTANAGTTPQSAAINTAFANALAVTVKDAGSNPVSGVNVTFTAPGAGASGVFSNSTATITVVTNASGMAAAPFTANATAGGPYTVTAAATGLTTVNFSLTNLSASGPIALVQHASSDAGTTKSSTLAFPSSNTAGNFIAVVIRAGKTGQLFTVTDFRQNTYRKAMQFNETIDSTTLGIFYAENIAGGADTITVSDTISGTMRFAILEYSGVAMANSLDGAAVAAQGTSASPNSGIVTTTTSGDLVLAGISTANTANFTAGSGYFARDFVPAEPNTKLLVEDQIQSVAGNISASASLGASDNWGAAVAAFKSAAGSGGTGPSITGLSPASGASGTTVTISGLNFGSTQGSSTVTFNGTIATPMNWAATTIMVSVPAGASTGNVVVTVGGVASNGVSFAVLLPPSITSLTPNSGAIGTSVTIAGANFGTSQGSSTVTFNGVAATPTIWSATSITATVPNGAITGNVVVTVGGVLSNGVAFTVTNPGPSISTLSLSQGPVGASITITGLNFGALQGASTLTFGGTAATPTSWSDTSIDAPVPSGATTGNVVVTVNNFPSNGLPFIVTPPPVINNISPTAGPIGTVVTINGTNFGPTIGTRASIVLFNGITARPNNWSDTQILVPVPAGATTGNVVVSLSGVLSNGVKFTVASPPSITNLNPSSGPVGTSVTISGANFGATQGTSAVTFNGLTASPTSWNDLTITVPVPSGASTGNVVVTVNGLASPGVNFSVPSSGAPITLVQHTRLD